MEPNVTSSSPAAGTSPAAVLEHVEPSVRDPSLLSPAFSSAPSPSLVPASGSGSEEAGNGSLSVDAHATSSQSLPSSFPTAGTLPTVGYDLFGYPEATEDTPLPTLLGGQWEQGESSSILPECPSPGLFGFAGESAAWPNEEMSPIFSPSFAGGLAPQKSDNLVGFAQPSSESEMEPLRQSLLTSLAVEESPVDAPLPPLEQEEEKIDVSTFLVSDPEDDLPNESRTASIPQTAGSGGGASTSWMAPRSTGNNWPPMLAPPAASASTMLSTSSGSMPCHSGGSSIGVASSIGGMMKPSSPVLPLVPLPSSQGAGGARSSNSNGFAQPSSSSVLAPFAPDRQGPLLPTVKQEVMDTEYVDATARRHHPDFISLVDDDEDGLYQDGSNPVFYPPDSGLNAWASSSSGHSQGPCFSPDVESKYNVFGSWGSSSPNFAPGSWGGSSSSSPWFAAGSWPGSSSGSSSFAPGSWGGGSSSSSPSFAPGSWGSCGGSPSFAPGSWGGGSGPSIAPSRWGGWGGGSPSFAPSSWGGSSSSSPSFAGSTACFDRSTSIDNYGSSSMSKFGLPPLPKAGASSSKRGSQTVFTDHEMAIIAKQENLQELLRTDPKKVKRILYNRAYSAMAKARKAMRTKDLERLVVTLETQRKSLCAELQSLEEGSAVLMAKKMEMQMLIGELERQTMLKDVVREGLRAEIEKLKHLELN